MDAALRGPAAIRHQSVASLLKRIPPPGRSRLLPAASQPRTSLNRSGPVAGAAASVRLPPRLSRARQPPSWQYGRHRRPARRAPARGRGRAAQSKRPPGACSKFNHKSLSICQLHPAQASEWACQTRLTVTTRPGWQALRVRKGGSVSNGLRHRLQPVQHPGRRGCLPWADWISVCVLKRFG